MTHSEAARYQQAIRRQLEAAGLTLDSALAVEAADFGLGCFPETGLGLVVRVNEPEYCSKWLTLFPGQRCPRHYHQLKKETFLVLQGVVLLEADTLPIVLSAGQSFTLHPGVRHAFHSETGAVIEEVSTHDEDADSYFDDPAIVRTPILAEDDE
jgi:D-lyxose ketol-isomerase